MCLILVRDPEIQLPYDSIKQAVLNNPDGWGYVIPDRGQLVIRRHFDKKGTDPDDVYEVLDDYLDKKIFLHLRYATAGEKNPANCHPFPALQQRRDGMQVWVMHNGTVGSYKNSNDKMSDTWHFTQQVITPLLQRAVRFSGKKAVLQDPFVAQVIDKFANNWSKWVLVDNYGNHTIIGTGVQKEGYWVSNDYSFQADHRKPATTTVTTGKGYYYPGYNGVYSSHNHQPYPGLGYSTSGVIDTSYEEVDKSDAPFSQASSDAKPGSTSTAIARIEEARAEPQAPLDEKERTSFLELCGLRNIRELGTLTEEDLLDFVREYPELMAVLIQDLLWELDKS